MLKRSGSPAIRLHVSYTVIVIYLFRISWLEVSSTHYAPGSVVVISMDHFIPTFAVITDILVQKVDEFYFVCNVLETACFVPHYHSYEVSHKAPAEIVICKQSSLIDHNVLGLYKVRESLSFVSLKYHLIEHLV